MTTVSPPCLVYDKVSDRWFVYGENFERLAVCSCWEDGRFRVSIDPDTETLSRQEVRLVVDALESLLAAEPNEPDR